MSGVRDQNSTNSSGSWISNESISLQSGSSLTDSIEKERQQLKSELAAKYLNKIKKLEEIRRVYLRKYKEAKEELLSDVNLSLIDDSMSSGGSGVGEISQNDSASRIIDEFLSDANLSLIGSSGSSTKSPQVQKVEINETYNIDINQPGPSGIQRIPRQASPGTLLENESMELDSSGSLSSSSGGSSLFKSFQRAGGSPFERLRQKYADLASYRRSRPGYQIENESFELVDSSLSSSGSGKAPSPPQPSPPKPSPKESKERQEFRQLVKKYNALVAKVRKNSEDMLARSQEPSPSTAPDIEQLPETNSEMDLNRENLIEDVDLSLRDDSIPSVEERPPVSANVRYLNLRGLLAKLDRMLPTENFLENECMLLVDDSMSSSGSGNIEDVNLSLVDDSGSSEGPSESTNIPENIPILTGVGRVFAKALKNTYDQIVERLGASNMMEDEEPPNLSSSSDVSDESPRRRASPRRQTPYRPDMLLIEEEMMALVDDTSSSEN